MSPVAARPVTYGLDAAIARLTVPRYQRMIETGILDADDKVELLEGYLVLKMARNPKHDSTIQRIQSVLYRRLPQGWDVRTQLAVTLVDSQPEPDFAVVRGDAGRYETAYPGPADIGLLVEVADTSLLRDRLDKARIYARSGVAAYWVVNLPDRRVEAFSQPPGPTTAPAYAVSRSFQPGDDVPIELDGAVAATVPVAELIG
jgi:Uma2 family endonuclease